MEEGVQRAKRPMKAEELADVYQKAAMSLKIEIGIMRGVQFIEPAFNQSEI